MKRRRREALLSLKKRAVHEIRTAIVSQCDEARKRLSGRTVAPEDLHSARKALKKARAWLRLVRIGTSPRAFREHNHSLRDAARPLSEGRDAQILIETLHKLLKRHREPARDRRFGRFERALQKDRRDIQRRLTSSRMGIAASRRLLCRSRTARTRMPIRGRDSDVIGAELQEGVRSRTENSASSGRGQPHTRASFMSGARTRRIFGITFKCSSRFGQELSENGQTRPTN